RRWLEEAEQDYGPRSAEAKAARDRLTARQKWDAECRKVDEQHGTTYAAQSAAALADYRAVQDAFSEMEPTTPLGIFLKHLNTDDGEAFADRPPDMAEIIIAAWQAAPATKDVVVATLYDGLTAAMAELRRSCKSETVPATKKWERGNRRAT